MRRSLLVFLCLLLLAGVALAEVVFQDLPYPPEEMGITPEALPEPTVQPMSGSVEILITAAGDVTLGGNMRKNPKSTMYTKLMDEIGGDLSHFFANVYDIFSQDDLTIVNFEGTLTEATKHKDNEFVFRAPAEHVQMLTLGSVEAVALENNHVMDFYQQGYDDTVAALTGAGIVYASDGRPGVFTAKGVTIGMLAYQTFDQYARLFEQVPKDVAALKAQVDMVIVSFHWGAERDYAPNANQIKLGRMTIDAGADLVLGHHSHRINPIECYNGKYIVYSLSNCSFSGNTRPSDMDTFLFQQKFTVGEGYATPGPFRIIPASISSVTGKSGDKTGTNDLAVTPFEPGGKGAKRVIETMLKNGKSLTYAVENYPTEW